MITPEELKKKAYLTEEELQGKMEAVALSGATSLDVPTSRLSTELLKKLGKYKVEPVKKYNGEPNGLTRISWE